jgi:hypothetical protein
MSILYVAERHDQVLSLWRAQETRSLRVLHLDFHCDMRGLLVDRIHQRAYRYWNRYQAPDFGNFLAHAILDGHVQAVRWVHDMHGGRQYDVGTVKYTTDLTALPHRLLLAINGDHGTDVNYEVIQYSDWTGLLEGEHLDIDWDFFASTDYPADTIGERAQAFLERDFPIVPPQTSICYSPDYSHPSRDLFWRFINSLADIFQAEVKELEPEPSGQATEPMSFYRRWLPAPLYHSARRKYHDLILGLKRRGLY